MPTSPRLTQPAPASEHPIPLTPFPGEGGMVLKVRRTFGAWAKMMPLFKFAGRPEAVPYICALSVLCKGNAFAQPSQSPAVTAPPKGEPRHIPHPH